MPTDFSGFYLGREWDLAKHEILPARVHYDPRDLTTHGVVVGMTGSGKTGLCITLLEEAALEGVPCVIIDLKGDLSNLLLNFPEMKPEDFEAWVNPDEARRKDLSVPEYARILAQSWRDGLAQWEQDLERVQQLRDSSDWRIYTPGSEAGRSVSVIRNFTAPQGDVGREALNDKVEATTTALLGLMNVNADPVQSREHILIANLLLHAWLAGNDLDLPRLIAQIQSPPLRKIGTFDVDMFYPEEDRLKLAITLNNLLASPSFSTWIEGDPLDLASMLRAPDGRPRQLIFYLAHLDDSQRMFFLTLLLQEMLSWTRSQPGSSNLRALLYFDEVFGYLPPHPANPPTKQPLMTLLKQARAFGVGILLATQNPVDLDYKALTNAGTWFVGKLRTDRDKARLLEGLEGIEAEQGTLTDRGYLDNVISSLDTQHFLLHDIHRDKPVVFHTRWALSYLTGPLTRDQLIQFKAMTGRGVPAPAPAIPANCLRCQTPLPPEARFCMQCGAPTTEAPTPPPEAEEANGRTSAHVPPILPPGMVQYFLSPVEGEGGTELVYEPRLLAFAEMTLSDRARKVETPQTFRWLVPAPEPGRPVAWEAAEEVSDQLESALPQNGEATWSDVPETLNDPKKLKALERSLLKHLYDRTELTLHSNRGLGMFSEVGEGLEAFLQRCNKAAQQLAKVDLDTARAAHQPQADLDALRDYWHAKAQDIKEVRLTPRKTDIQITHFGLGWAPFRVVQGADGEKRVPAYRRTTTAK